MLGPTYVRRMRDTKFLTLKRTQKSLSLPLNPKAGTAATTLPYHPISPIAYDDGAVRQAQ